MKYIENIEAIDQLPGRRIERGDTFRFRCHPDVGCFNQCCRNLNLFLYPYDLIRLKKRLEISSDRFLEEYVDVVLRDGNFFPEVLLRMADNDAATCPFLTDAGCRVYPDRPGTCRSYPVEHGVRFDAASKKTELVHFFRPPETCLGANEDQELTIDDWLADQEAKDYHRMTLRWAEVRSLFAADPWGAEGPNGPRAKMAFMAAYNIDAFREFVYKSSFTKRYRVKPEVLKRARLNDEALLKLGFEWIEFFIWGKKPASFKPKGK